MLNAMKGLSSSESVQQGTKKKEKQKKGGDTVTKMDNCKTQSNLRCPAQNAFCKWRVLNSPEESGIGLHSPEQNVVIFEWAFDPNCLMRR